MMIYEEFIRKWNGINAFNSSNAMMRIDAQHPLDFFVGMDNENQLQLMLLSSFEPQLIPRSRAINVTIGKRHDNRWAVCFILNEMSVKEQFINLCWDLFESSKNFRKTKDDINCVLARFIKWQRLMEMGRNGLLPLSSIKGLLGELLFLEKYALAKHDIYTAIRGWTGPEKTDRDFVFNEKWFEVKSIDPGASEVSISSIEQLDIDYEGSLVVFLLEKTSPTENGSVTLTTQVDRIRDLIKESPVALKIFEDKLLDFGYIDRKEYSDIAYALRGSRWFIVNDSFPRLRRNSMPPQIQKAAYTLSIAGISKWEVQPMCWEGD